MPPLEEIGRPNPTAAAAAASTSAIGTSPARVAGSTAMSEYIARALCDDSDDESVVEIVDLPDANLAHDEGNGGDGATSPANMARRTRSHDRRTASAAAGTSSASAAAAASASISAAAAAAAAPTVDMSMVTSPSPARRKPSGGLKTTGLDSEDTTPAQKPAAAAAGKKRSADEVNNSDGAPKQKEEGTDNDDNKDTGKKKEAEQHCSICLDVPSREEVTKLNKCEHVFCFGCIETWADRENTCPLCKVRFTKIERVNKPPPTKRRKKGGGGRGSGGAKATKRIKTRDQREDLVSANPLEGLFAHLESTGTMPRSIAQLIFSGLGGPNTFGGPYRYQSAAARRHPATHRNDATPSYTVARDPTTGRFTRVPRRQSASSSGASSPSPAAGAGAARRSTRNGGSSGAAASSSSSGAAAAAAASSSSRSARARRSGTSGAPHVSVTLNSFGPTSFNLPGPPSPDLRGVAPPRAFRFFQDSDEDDDDYEPPFARAGGYDSFVRRARAQQGRAQSPLAPDSFVVRREISMPPTQAHLAPANTADTAIEIGDSDDDDDVVVLD